MSQKRSFWDLSAEDRRLFELEEEDRRSVQSMVPGDSYEDVEESYTEDDEAHAGPGHLRRADIALTEDISPTFFFIERLSQNDEAKRHRAVLRNAFQASGISFRGGKLDRLLLASAAGSLERFPYQHAEYVDRGDDKASRPDTKAPVEKVQHRLSELFAAINECTQMANVIPSPGQMNMSSAFMRDLRGTTLQFLVRGDRRERQLDALGILEVLKQVFNGVASSSLMRGVEKPSKRPPLVTYDDLVIRLAEFCRCGKVRVRDGKGGPLLWFIRLVKDCEPLLPIPLQTLGDNRTLQRRVQAALKRARR